MNETIMDLLHFGDDEYWSGSLWAGNRMILILG